MCLRQPAARCTRRDTKYEADLQGTGLRATQFTLLQALERTGATPQGALGELLALRRHDAQSHAPPARAGWIRAGAGRDRREVRWNLTSAGRAAVAERREGAD